MLHYIHGGGWSIGNLAIVTPPASAVSSPVDGRGDEHLSARAGTGSRRIRRHPGGGAMGLGTSRTGGESRPVVIGGDSAGGNLTAAVRVALRDDRQGSERSTCVAALSALTAQVVRVRFTQDQRRPSLRTEALRMHRRLPLRGRSSDPWASPATARYRGFRALVVVLTVDPLRDEAVAYAEALRNAGVQAELMEFSNLTLVRALWGIIPAAASALSQIEQQLWGLSASST
jgi:acetyl esterase